MKTKTKNHFLKLTILCFDLTNFREVINDCLLKEITDNVYYQHMSVATQHSYTPLKGLNKRTAFAFTKMEGEKKTFSVLVHACPSRMSKSSGKVFLSLIGD